MSNLGITQVGVLVGAALLLGGATYGVHRATRNTHGVRVRKQYGKLLSRAGERLSLFERSVRDLAQIKRVTPPRMFTLDADEVEEALRKVHRRETQACLALAEINALKVSTEVPMNSPQVLRQRKLRKRLNHAVKLLRDLEAHAHARGVRLDRAAACRADAPNVETLAAKIHERNERRATSRRKAQHRAEQSKREQKSRQKHKHTNTIAFKLRELVDKAEGDEELFEQLLSEDLALISRIGHEDPPVLEELAQDYPAVYEAAKGLGFFDGTKPLFEE